MEDPQTDPNTTSMNPTATQVVVMRSEVDNQSDTTNNNNNTTNNNNNNSQGSIETAISDTSTTTRRSSPPPAFGFTHVRHSPSRRRATRITRQLPAPKDRVWFFNLDKKDRMLCMALPIDTSPTTIAISRAGDRYMLSVAGADAVYNVLHAGFPENVSVVVWDNP